MSDHAPRITRHIIAACVPAEDVDAVLYDLDCLHSDRVAAMGSLRARLWYYRQGMSFVTRVGLRRVIQFVGERDGLRDEVRYSVRSLARRPAFALSFILTLAIGAGVVATVYAAARWVLLRPVPGVLAPDQLVILQTTMKEAPPHVTFGLSQPDLEIFRSRLPADGRVAATTRIEVDLSAPAAGPRRVAGEMISANYFGVLGARLVAGRSFAPAEEREISPVAIVNEDLARQLGTDAQGVVGTNLVINGRQTRVIGVAPSDFRGAEVPGTALLWMPLSAREIIDPSAGPGAASNSGDPAWKDVIIRPREGVTKAVLQLEADAIVALIRREKGGQPHSFMMPPMEVRLVEGLGLDPAVRASTQRTLAFLGGAAALLLLLAIANLANLTLTRAMTLGPAIAIRAALGASRARIARRFIVDALVLGVMGTIGALALAGAWTRWFQGTQLDERGAALQGVHVDLRALGVALAVSVLASMVAFVKPAFLTKVGAIDAELRRARMGSGGRTFRMSLVAAQVAFTVVLLVGAGLLARTVATLRDVDLGFDPDRLLTFSIEPHLHGVEAARLAKLANDFERRAAENPAVRSAGLISPAPLASSYFTASMRRPGTDPRSNDPSQRGVSGAGYYVSPGFLRAIKATFIVGDSSWNAERGTVVLTRSAAAQLYPGERVEAVANRMAIARRDTLRIAAVIEDVRLSDITQDPPPSMFFPLDRRVPGLSMAGFVAADSRASRLAPALQDIMRDVAPELPLYGMRTARDAVDLQFAERMAMARAATTLGIIGLLLAALGLYGVLASIVAARQRDIGIRAAVGAGPGRLVGGVLRDGFLPVLVGLAIGGAGAVAVTKVIRSQLFAVDRFDIAAWSLALGSLLLTALIACAVPAVRASRISPAEVLRAE